MTVLAAPAPAARPVRRARLALLATMALVLGGAGLPGSGESVLIVNPTLAYTFTCVLHTQGVAGPGVGVLMLVTKAVAPR